MKSVVEDKLDRLERAGILEKVNFSKLATPKVAVPKKDGGIRIC